MSPSGRPRQRLGEEQRRTQITSATIAVVAEHGYEGTSLARIAAHAGISKGLISHYFADKDELLEHTVTVTVATIRETIASQLDLLAPVPDVIRVAIHKAAALRTTHRAELMALNQIARNLRSPDGTPRISLAHYEETHQRQQELFERGQAEGSLRPLDARVMAVTYQGAIDTMLGYAEVHPDMDLDHYAAELADLLLAGFAQR